MITPSRYRRLDTTTAVDYVRKAMPDFENLADLECTELSDGNINYVFRVSSPGTGRSIILKQADVLLRSSGRPLDQDRIRIEAAALSVEHALAPDQVPEVCLFDPEMSLMVMEDVGEFHNLRKLLMSGHVPTGLAAELARFLVAALLPTTDLVMDRAEKKLQQKSFVNPELCDITEDLVLTEPYYNYKDRNLITEENLGFVEEKLYTNEPVRAVAAELRHNFMNNAEALLHGDIHTGSIFANDTGIRVIDPEFATYGPMGYDIGNVIGNLVIARSYHLFTPEGDPAVSEQIDQVIRELVDALVRDFPSAYDELVTLPLYKDTSFREQFLSHVRADSLGYAGTELVRRGIGDARCAEVGSLPEGPVRARMERAMVLQGIALMLQRHDILDSDGLMAALNTAAEEI